MKADDTGRAGSVLVVHVGHAANCSSIGSVIDYLFLGAGVASAVVSGVAVALGARRAAGHASGSESDGPATDEPGGAPSDGYGRDA